MKKYHVSLNRRLKLQENHW